MQSVKARAGRPLSESYDRYQRYDGLYRYHRHHLHAVPARSITLIFFSLSLSLPKRPACVFGFPNPPFFSVCLSRSQGGREGGNMPENRALPAGRRSGRFANHACLNWNFIASSQRVVNSRIEASLYAPHPHRVIIDYYAIGRRNRSCFFAIS